MKKNKKNKPLGIGLEALIPSYQTGEKKENYIDHISINMIIPNANQPRQIFSEDNMNDLVESIRENGILQPLLVRIFDNNQYELIAGERRFRAAKQLKLEKVPVYVLNIEDDEEMLKLALIENIQRDNLSSIEEAEGYAILKGKFGFSESEISKQVGKNRTTIANKLRLIKLPPDLKNALRMKDANFTEGHARAILSLRESKKMINLFIQIKKNKLSVRETERLVKNKKIKIKSTINKKKKYNKNLINFQDSLIAYLSTKVVINANKNKGKLNIYFSSNEDLERIIELILNEN